MTEFKDILGGEKGKLPEDKLLAYLEGKLPPEEQHEIERWLHEEGMESDAIDGLQGLPASETKRLVHDINKELKKTLHKSKRKYKNPIKNNYWALVAIVIILLVVLAGYVVFLLMIKK